MATNVNYAFYQGKVVGDWQHIEADYFNGPEPQPYTAYLPSDITWNGWACPFFEIDEAYKVVEQIAPGCWEYNEATDTFKTWGYAQDGQTYEDADQWPGSDITLPNGETKHVYAIGAWCWTWDEE